jgi:DNA polymerase-1
MTQAIRGALASTSAELIETVDDARRFIEWIKEKGPRSPVGIDIETGQLPGNPKNDALSPWKGRIRLIQVGDQNKGWAMAWPHWSGVFYEAMRIFQGPLVFHNISFENKWFRLHSEWQIPWHRAHDTMVISSILFPSEPSVGLKKIAEKYVDPNSASAEYIMHDQMRTNGFDWGTVPVNFQPYWAYGALDTILTTRIWDMFYDTCAPNGPYSRAYELEMNVRRIADEMELSGARIDLGYIEVRNKELRAEAERIKYKVQEDYNILISSPSQVGRKLVEMGAQLDETAKNNISVDKVQLERVLHSGNGPAVDLANLVVRHRDLEKMCSSYFENFMDQNIDGVLHPSIRTIGARTSRMSIREPALQTLPSDDENIRRAFIPRDPGSKIITSDLDQVEFRMFAAYCQDPGLIEMFRLADETGSDAFTQIGRQVYQDPSMEKSDSRRSLIKGVIYGRLYGAGVAKQAATAGVAVEQMQAVSNSLDANYPLMASFQHDVTEAGKLRIAGKEPNQPQKEGYINTWTGRRITCDSDRPYTLVNYLIQGGAAEVFKNNLVKLDQANLTSHLIVPVHDEIVLEAPEKDAREIMQTVKECMTSLDWAVPLTAGVDGPYDNWGQKYAKK